MASTRKITLKSTDGEAFDVDEAVALECQTIKHAIECDSADCVVPLPNVSSKILSKVIEYCKKHVDAGAAASGGGGGDEDLKSWDAEFVKVDRTTLFELILAANYLNIKSLLDLTTQTAADMIKGKTALEISTFFNIQIGHLTPEEEEEYRRENAWAFEEDDLARNEEEEYRRENAWAFEEDDLARNEEEEYRRENAWAFEEDDLARNEEEEYRRENAWAFEEDDLLRNEEEEVRSQGRVRGSGCSRYWHDLKIFLSKCCSGSKVLS